MQRQRTRLVLAALGGLLTLGVAGAAPDAAPAVSLDPARVNWNRLAFKASKLFLTARSEVQIAPVSPEATRAALIGPEAPLPSEGELRLLSLRSELLGRESLLRLWFHSDDGAAIQRIQVETGSRNRYKGYRFFPDGVYSLRRVPQKGEAALPPEQWSDVGEGYDRYPLTAVAVTEPSALFYVLSASTLAAPGDALGLHVYSKNKLMELEIRVLDRRALRVAYDVVQAGARREIRGTVEALRLSVTGRQVAAGATGEDFEFLGLRGDVEVYLDPATRVPLQVSGALPVFGGVDVRLQRVELEPALQTATE